MPGEINKAADPMMDERLVVLRVSRDELEALMPHLHLIQGKPMHAWRPLSRLALRITAAAIAQAGECMVCGCTEEDCRECIERTGAPCSWVNGDHTVCSACLEEKS